MGATVEEFIPEEVIQMRGLILVAVVVSVVTVAVLVGVFHSASQFGEKISTQRQAALALIDD